MHEGDVLLGRYKLVSTLGRGSFGQVYLAQDLSSGGEYRAIKQMIPDKANKQFREGEQSELWRQEVQTLGRLTHPSLPRIFESFYQPAGFFIVMEWVSGKMMEDVMRERRQSFEQLEVLFWGIEMADLLNYLHNNKPYPIVYGDLKPANIMVTYDGGHIKMIDFGVARFLDPAQMGKRTFTMVSPGFSPPEQYKSPDIDQRCDIYALGATLYALLTRENMERFKFNVPSVARLRRDVHPDLDAVLDLCLMQDPAERYQSIAEVYRDLLRIFQELREEAQSG